MNVMRSSLEPTGSDAAASGPSVLAVTHYRPTEIVDSMASMTGETHVLTLEAHPNPLWRSLDSARLVRRAIRRHDPDLLLLDSYETIGVPVVWMASRYDVPVVARLVGDTWRIVSEERIDPARRRRQPLQFAIHRTSYALNEYIFERAEGFVAVSSELGKVIARRTGCPSDRIGIVPVPLPTASRDGGSAAAGREALGGVTERVLLTVTNLKFRAKLEGVETVLAAVAPLLRADPDLSYVIAGGGQYHDALLAHLEDRIDDPSVRERIHAPGHVDAVADLYALADVFAYVSTLDGYPNAVLEAQAAGLPVVANDAHGMRDQITDGETGFLVDGTAEALHDRISFLLETPSARRRIGRQGQLRAQQENAPEVVSARLEAFLCDLDRAIATGTPSSD